MKRVLHLAALLLLNVTNGNAQTQSIVIQKNTLPDANKTFSFSTSGPVGSAFASAPTLSLNNPFGGKQPLEVGASSAGSGYIAFTQKDAPVNAVFTYASGASAWSNPSPTALRLDYETTGKMWLVGTDNNLYEFNGTTTTLRYSGVKDVGVGSDNKVYLIGFSDHVYRIDPGFVYTDLTPSSTAKRVDGGPSGSVWYIGSNDHIFYYNGSTTTDMGLAPSSKPFKDLSVGADGKCWAIAENPTNAAYTVLYYWNGSAWVADALAPTGTTMYNIAVGADNEPLLTLNFNGGRTYLLKRLSDGRWVEIQAQTTGNNNTLIYYNQPTGSYSFTESATAGYYLQDIVIFGSTADSYSTTTGTTTLTLNSNEHAYVQYTNVVGSKPAAQTISTACGGTFVETFGTGTPNTVSSLPAGQTTYIYNSNPMGKYQGNGINDGQYALTTSVYDATGYFYQWISGPGVNGAACSYTCDIHGDATYGLSKVASDTDHTAGDTNGQMLLVNADFTSGVYYQKEYAGLAAGNSYQFSAWLANVLLGSATDATDPNVILRVVDLTTGQILLDLPSGDIPKTGTTLTWVEKKGSFLAPASGNVIVYLINNKPGGQGNDLVLDDISLTATCLTISGQVFNDANGMTDNLVNGVGTNTSSPLYAVLTDGNNKVISYVTLPANGTYSFANLFTGTYSVKITTTLPGAAGTTAPNASHTSGWLNTGTNTGTGNALGTTIITSGNMDSVRISVTTTDVVNVDFGLERAPTANAVSSPGQMNPGGTNTAQVPTLNGSDPEDGTYDGISGTNTVIIKTLPTNAILYYNGIAVVAGDTIKNYDPTLLQVDPIDGTQIVTFTYSEVDAALVASAPATVTMPFTPTLPVRLISFNGVADQNKIGITWNTVTETNTAAFTIEKSTNGNVFTSVASVTAKGIGSSYSINDNAPANGTNYYRIKITDNNGSVTYSKVISVKYSKQLLITVYPNPVINNLFVKSTGNIKSVMVADATGKMIFRSDNINKDLTKIKEVNKWQAGVYFITVVTAEGTFRQKIIKSAN